MVFGNMGEMVKMAREMQGKLKELSREVFEGSAEGVVAKVSGDMELKEIKIDPRIVDPNNVGRLEKNVSEAVKRALKTSKDEAAKKMKGLTGGLNIPGLT